MVILLNPVTFVLLERVAGVFTLFAERVAGQRLLVGGYWAGSGRDPPAEGFQELFRAAAELRAGALGGENTPEGVPKRQENLK